MGFWRRSAWQGPPPRNVVPPRPVVDVVPPPVEESLSGPAAQRRRAMERGARVQVQRMRERELEPRQARVPSARYDAMPNPVVARLVHVPAATARVMVRADVHRFMAAVGEAVAQLILATERPAATRVPRRTKRLDARNRGARAAAARRMTTQQNHSARRARRRANRERTTR